jgi:hypothetical protein
MMRILDSVRDFMRMGGFDITISVDILTCKIPEIGG